MKLPEFWHQWIGAIIGGIAGEFFGFLFIWLVLEETLGRSIGAALLFALLAATLGHQLRFIPEIRTKIEETLEKRMNQIIEFTALGTQNGCFEKVLDKLRDPNLGNIKWAIAKFISHKLNKDFNNMVEIEYIPIKEYSNLLSELIVECRSSIYFTCPYYPKEWFSKLGVDPCTSCGSAGCSYETKKEHLPQHFQSFCDSPVKDKKRIVNLTDNDWNAFIDGENSNDKCKCFNNFLRYKEGDDDISIETDKKISLVFVKQQDLKDRWGDELSGIIEEDYNILDDKVVMMWKPYESGGAEGKCRLIFDKAEIERYKRIFLDIEESIFKTPVNIQKLLNC